MDIVDFLNQFVEGYLFGDLESMSGVGLPTHQNYGAIGYPMVATTLTGIELLGCLLMPNTDKFSPHKSGDYFLNYWNNYLSTLYPEYTQLGKACRQLMRNGLAHSFMAKRGVFIEKGSNKQISIDKATQQIHIDCNVFFREFQDSYMQLVRPIVDGTAQNPKTNKTDMQFRLDDMSRTYSNQTADEFNSLPTLFPPVNDFSDRSKVPTSRLFVNPGFPQSAAPHSISPTTQTQSTTYASSTPINP